ncbi:bifunctional hydroxymethylpyrimidine kinase/phosphomethylpyrimidine kinase [Enterococcus durans]|uniref:bifunctional hydroxymethylpyrimidine kinase/phosphomethylpyrimidine kinase n=1 Tax=Enterococcus durans TaxID=53345 RepID=UPI00115B41EF|nr:bifunctional hydroxymethylpyrimidine kinase/phosphomethylpyrimidine kinase [Enterococcus durans]MBE9887152.1 bifunctional hydroxymethylpyrimidine kinase/phosphomethylpyrimidine kinase [Enterococcus durans]MDB1653516.1 bifunctional hydroxymethylpyrimidine kinase/phosphomethylpyrimidine kinase [Enterococcus durans]MDB1656466.1 bifunctional hydroxymethylpyrimidine kinase/phosphomethylpyrimidine kinase [Enterococcus durans]MDB1663682.1 bifunctional hydroxymethylpyrimidine kinase/phosphomethylpyr
MEEQYLQVMTIAGSDSDGSAGMQADMHTFFTRGVYGVSVMTACVAGNSYGIGASVTLPTDFIDKEFALIAEDYQVKAAKTGMLADSTLIETVVENYQKYDFGPLVVDPVIVTKHGNLLLEESALQSLKDKLLPLATVLTPNFYEAEKLTGRSLSEEEDYVQAAKELQQMGAKNVMIKGHHLKDADQKDVKDYVLLESGKSFWLSAPFYPTDRINGTGDSLSACIAAELAKGKSVEEAIRFAKEYVNVAIREEIHVGHKYGPINHWAAGALKESADF